MARTSDAVLLDLLMAVMDSPAAWARAAGDAATGMRWRDAVTAAMIRAGRYEPYEQLVAEAADGLGLSARAPQRLWSAWAGMEPRSDALAVQALLVPYAFVTNCSSRLAAVAAARSGLAPAFTLSAEEAGWYKPRPEIYRMACERIGADPEGTRFVAGAVYDAEGARLAGLRSALVARRPIPPTLHVSVERAGNLADALPTGVRSLPDRSGGW